MEHWTAELEQLSPDRRRAMEFLLTHLPESDLDCYPFSLFLRFADHALALRQQAPWCAGLEEELFLHYVLFPRVNDEDLSFHRALFHDALWERISALSSQEERVLEVNRWCHEEASYQFQDDRTASPLTVFRSGSGRCGEESAFLVSALRSVGIAARQVYSPRWAHCDDNHAWVEALCDGRWRFLGACEPEPILDRGWFNTAASRAILVHSRLFGRGKSPLHGDLLETDGAVCWYNQTGRYAHTQVRTFRVLRDGLPAPDAAVQLQVLNEASFHTVATLTTGPDGTARAELGLGDLHVAARLDGLTAEGDCAGDSLTLVLSRPAERSGWREFDVRAPKDAPVHPTLLTPTQKTDRAAVLAAGSAKRHAKLDRADRSAQAPEDWRDLVRDARSNGAVIEAFLRQDGDPRREALLRTLTRKDLRDVTAEVLCDHLDHAPPLSHLPEAVYTAWVLSPRIELEPLTPWRQALSQAFSPAEQSAYRADPAALWQTLLRRMDTQLSRVYTGRITGLVWTPLEAWQARRCNGRSLRILYVATLRALGVPARLRKLDGMPEFWQNGSFHPLRPQAQGRLSLTCGEGQTPLYRQNWSLSLWNQGEWQLLQLSDEGWDRGARTLSLPAGHFRLTTSVRMPNGNQFAASRDLCLRAGETVRSDLRLRSFALEDLLGCQDLPPMTGHTLTQPQRTVSVIPEEGRPTLLFWLEEGNEPTEHVLNELSDGREALRALPVDVVFLVRGAESVQQRTLAGVLAAWPEIRVLTDDWYFDLETVARHLTCDPDRPPLAVACNRRGQAVYGVSGYHVGSVELLTRIAAHLTRE